MIKSLKTIVITLAILILILVSIILITLYSRFSSNFEKEYNYSKNEYLNIKQKYDIVSFDIENHYLYVHLKSNDSEKIKIINLKNLNDMKDIYLK